MFVCLLFTPDHRSRTPIIIVPSATTSLITMLNVKTLLEEYKLAECSPIRVCINPILIRFLPSEEMKRLGVKRQMDMVIQRRKPHPTQPGQTVSIPYRVTDSPMRLKPPEWWEVLYTVWLGNSWVETFACCVNCLRILSVFFWSKTHEKVYVILRTTICKFLCSVMISISWNFYLQLNLVSVMIIII